MEEAEIIKTHIRNNRYHVQLQFKNHKETMPLANYTWLKHNPAFKAIPKGYVIHHLDNNSFNDDISNLALMQKHQHTSYHWKNKIIKPKIEIDPSAVMDDGKKRKYYQPLNEPWLTWKPKLKRYELGFSERQDDGTTKMFRLNSYKERPLKTENDAIWAKAQIWPETNQQECPNCQGKGFVIVGSQIEKKREYSANA